MSLANVMRKHASSPVCPDAGTHRSPACKPNAARVPGVRSAVRGLAALSLFVPLPASFGGPAASVAGKAQPLFKKEQPCDDLLGFSPR